MVKLMGQLAKYLTAITPTQIFRLITAWMAAVITTYVISSLFQSISVLLTLTNAGANISVVLWSQTIWHDLCKLAFGGKYVSYGVLIAQGFLCAFPTAALVRKLLGFPRALLYPLAGATSIATFLIIVNVNFFDLTLFAGTRGWEGFSLQLFAGAAGGLVFAVLLRKES